MDRTYDAIENFNFTFSNYAMSTEEYFRNFKYLAQNMQQPVLFYFGGHMPFLENKKDLEAAISSNDLNFD